MIQPDPKASPRVRWRGRSFVAVAAMVLAGATIAGCGDDDTADVGGVTTTDPAADDTASDGGDTAGETAIEIVSVSDGFQPDSATAAVGDEVVWVNTDATTHTATAEDGTWDSGDIAGGARFAFTPEEPGTYAYVCDIHPSMSGELVVE